MIDAVFDKTHDQHQASARCYSGEALQHRIVDGSNLIQAAAAGDQGDGERLQEIAAQGAADCADEGVTQKSEAMLARGGCREMRANNAGENLNNKIGRGPDHRTLRSAVVRAAILRDAAKRPLSKFGR
jgi:hypothetical protein